MKIDTIKFAVGRLSQWNSSSSKVPAAKLKCAIDFIKLLQGMLNETAKETSPDGADTLLPSCIFALLLMSPTQSQLIHSNLEYIRLFRHQDRLDGQDEYYLTTLTSAADFILNLSERDLKMDPGEYQRSLQGVI